MVGGWFFMRKAWLKQEMRRLGGGWFSKRNTWLTNWGKNVSYEVIFFKKQMGKGWLLVVLLCEEYLADKKKWGEDDWWFIL